jgi:hypothetical protein
VSASAPKLFISYRREETAAYAGRLYDALSRRFGEEQVFMDIGMEPGIDFVEQIGEAVAASRLLVAVIGPRWMSMEDASGRRRIDDPGDFVRVEIEAALQQADVRVVPVLVQGASMPSAEELPPSLAEFARRNALELSDARWRYDVDRLTSTVERVLGVRARPSGVSARPPPEATKETVETPEAAAVPKEPYAGAVPSHPARASRRKVRLGLLAAAVLAVLGVALALALSGGSGPRPPDVRARAAVDGQPVRVSIGKHGQQATVTFRGRAGQRVAPDLRDVHMSGLLSVIDPADEKLLDEYSFDGDGLIDPLLLQRSGTYTLHIDPDGDSRGSVKLRLYNVPPDVTRRATVDGPVVPISIGTPGQKAILKFRAAAGQRILLALRNVHFGGSVSVIDPAGQKLLEGEGFSQDEDKVIGPSIIKRPGVYTILIEPDDINTGDLKARLSQA